MHCIKNVQLHVWFITFFTDNHADRITVLALYIMGKQLSLMQ